MALDVSGHPGLAAEPVRALAGPWVAPQPITVDHTSLGLQTLGLPVQRPSLRTQSAIAGSTAKVPSRGESEQVFQFRAFQVSMNVFQVFPEMFRITNYLLAALEFDST